MRQRLWHWQPVKDSLMRSHKTLNRNSQHSRVASIMNHLKTSNHLKNFQNRSHRLSCLFHPLEWVFADIDAKDQQAWGSTSLSSPPPLKLHHPALGGFKYFNGCLKHAQRTNRKLLHVESHQQEHEFAVGAPPRDGASACTASRFIFLISGGSGSQLHQMKEYVWEHFPPKQDSLWWN